MKEQQDVKVLDIKVSRDKYDDTLVFLESTGEIIEMIKNTKTKKKVNPITKYVGIEVRYPKDCLTTDQLLETLTLLDAYVVGKARVNTHYLVESMAAGYITPQQQTFLYHLAKSLTGWNIFIGTREDLCKWGVDSKSLKRVMSSLEENYLRIVSENIPYKGCIILHISPLIGWRGDLQVRDQRKMDWYKVGSIDHTSECFSI